MVKNMNATNRGFIGLFLTFFNAWWVKQRTSKRAETNAREWLFPKHSAFLYRCLENELRVQNLAVFFASFFIRKHIYKTRSKFLPFMILGYTEIFFRNTIFNIWAEGSFLIRSTGRNSDTAESTPPTLFTSTTAAHYQKHVAKGGARTKINLIACIALQNHSRAGGKMCRRLGRKRTGRVGKSRNEDISLCRSIWAEV